MGVTSPSNKPHPLRQTEDGEWEVEIPPGNWMKCVTESDARRISNYPVLEEKACYATCPNQTLAAELEATADVLEKYGFGDNSRFFRSRAESMKWDVFISHASEDKEAFVRPLAIALQGKNVRVWFDEFALTVGDSLHRSIDHGLASSRYGIVVISPSFLEKEWPQKELDGLAAREVDGRKVILPVWHNVDAKTVRQHSPLLADRVATSTAKGIQAVVGHLMKAMG